MGRLLLEMSLIVQHSSGWLFLVIDCILFGFGVNTVLSLLFCRIVIFSNELFFLQNLKS